MSKNNAAVNLPACFSVNEMDERLEAAERYTDETSGFRAPANQTPHCDCKDKTGRGNMYPVATLNNGVCALCGHYTILKTPRNSVKHGTVYAYQVRKCRCDTCKLGMNSEWAKRRERFKLNYKGKSTK